MPRKDIPPLPTSDLGLCFQQQAHYSNEYLDPKAGSCTTPDEILTSPCFAALKTEEQESPVYSYQRINSITKQCQWLSLASPAVMAAADKVVKKNEVVETQRESEE